MRRKITKREARHIADPLQEEIRQLRLDNERLKDRVRAERRRSDQHADEIAFMRQQQAYEARRRLNGEFR